RHLISCPTRRSSDLSELGLSLLFISHDLSLVPSISARVMVMYLGKIVEAANTEDLFANPRHPYTAALIESIPTLDRARRPKLLRSEEHTSELQSREN